MKRLLLAGLLVLGLAACGGGDPPTTHGIESGDHVSWIHITRPDGTVMPCLRYQNTVERTAGSADSSVAYFALDCDWRDR